MKKSRLVLLVAVLLLTPFAAPALAQEGEESGAAAEDAAPGLDLGLLGATLGISIAAAGGALAQGRATGEACAGLARNPGAGGRIQLMLLIGLAFMESVVIYALVIALRGAGFF